VPFLFPEQPMILTALVIALLVNYAVHAMLKWHLVARIAFAAAVTVLAWALFALLTTLIITHPPIASGDFGGNVGITSSALVLACLFQWALRWVIAGRSK
jgi:fucose 4-O-acetylase-like acetyltransferase